MTTKLNALKIQVPTPRPAPQHAARIGEIFADLLAKAQATAMALAKALSATRPNTIRAELRKSAAEIETERPATALTLRSVAARGWIY